MKHYIVFVCCEYNQRVIGHNNFEFHNYDYANFYEIADIMKRITYKNFIFGKKLKGYAVYIYNVSDDIIENSDVMNLRVTMDIGYVRHLLMEYMHEYIP